MLVSLLEHPGHEPATAAIEHGDPEEGQQRDGACAKRVMGAEHKSGQGECAQTQGSGVRQRRDGVWGGCPFLIPPKKTSRPLLPPWDSNWAFFFYKAVR